MYIGNVHLFVASFSSHGAMGISLSYLCTSIIPPSIHFLMLLIQAVIYGLFCSFKVAHFQSSSILNYCFVFSSGRISAGFIFKLQLEVRGILVLDKGPIHLFSVLSSLLWQSCATATFQTCQASLHEVSSSHTYQSNASHKCFCQMLSYMWSDDRCPPYICKLICCGSGDYQSGF